MRRLLLLALFGAVSALPGQIDPFERGGIKVLIFLRTDCPISNRYAPELRRLKQKYSERGVNFWAVYPDASESAEVIIRHAGEYRHDWTVLRDPEHRLVKRAKVRVTPEAAVFGEGGRLLYHGRIDDRWVDFGDARPAATTRDLDAAIGAVLDGKAAARAAGPAVGCPIADLK